MTQTSITCGVWALFTQVTDLANWNVRALVNSKATPDG
jgi:hypothetical protein